MAYTKLRQIIRDGEGVAVEFKKCENELSNSVFETVSAFSNRYGGHLMLGVEDNGKIIGVNPNSISGIKKNFVNSLNNPQRFNPTLYIALEEENIDGKIVLWTYIPPNSQVIMFNGKIYDRTEDGDIDITRNSEMVTQIHRRKSADYSERQVFPYATEDDFEFARLLPKARLLAINHRPNHPWGAMTDKELLQSAGLYDKDLKTGKEGFNLAAILLFGKESTIRSCTPNYITDGICRRHNLDRYDDRVMIRTNLIDAYDRLIEFVEKHTLDKFFLIGGQSVSIRSKIAREIVSNILVHREYTSTYPAKIIIERNSIKTENWSIPQTFGQIDPNVFAPYPKNPLLASFFINIGRADILGSGTRNLYRFTKIYSGKEPELIDGDIFKMTIPVEEDYFDEEHGVKPTNDLVNEENVPVNSENVPVNTENVPVNDRTSDIISLIIDNNKITYSQLSEKLGVNEKTIKRDMDKLKKLNKVERVGSDKTGEWRVL